MFFFNIDLIKDKSSFTRSTRFYQENILFDLTINLTQLNFISLLAFVFLKMAVSCTTYFPYLTIIILTFHYHV